VLVKAGVVVKIGVAIYYIYAGGGVAKVPAKALKCSLNLINIIYDKCSSKK
jgi:hypothetical protein